MIAMTHTWVRHAEHGGYWQCPTDALDAMADLGWQPVDPSEVPPEPDPAVAERIAWEAARAAEAEKAESTSTRAARRGEPKE